MGSHTLSRRNLMQLAAAASTSIAMPRAAQARSPSIELLVLQEKLLVARAERDRLHQILRNAEGRRPSIPECIRDPHCRTQEFQSNNAIQLGKLDLAELAVAHEAGVPAADSVSAFDRHTIALEAAESVVCDIERAVIDFEPRSLGDLRLQVELALHQEVIDYGMDENLPRLICERFLRLIPA